MKYAFAALILAVYTLGCYTPTLVEKAENAAVEAAYNWSTARKFAHVQELPVAMPEKIEYDQIAQILKDTDR